MTRIASFALGGLAVAALLAPVAAARADDATPPAPAAPPAAPVPPTGRFFDQYDTNQDGKVTKEEFLAQKGDEAAFDVIDMDRDGTITLAELGLPADYKPRPLPPVREEPMGGGKVGGGGDARRRLQDLMAMDADKDGKISKEEYKGKAPFERLDRNGDGFITPEDFRGMKPGQGGAMNPEEILQRFKDQDKNGDGKVTKEEWQGPPERFEVLDANHDGAVSFEEIQAALKNMPPPAPGGGDGKFAKRYDKNGDGRVQRDEFPGSDETFKALDKNGDGCITDDEVEGIKVGKVFGKKGEGKPGDPPKAGEPPKPEGGEMPMPPGEKSGSDAPTGALPPLFAVLDKNRDGKITRDEFPGTDDEWRKLDRDVNGWITPDEVR